MGGVGSGRGYQRRRLKIGVKLVTRDLPRFDVSHAVKLFKANGGVYSVESISCHLEDNTIKFKDRTDRTLLTKPIEISTMRCYLGGERYFGTCPFCSKRFKILYLFKGVFTCRCCLRLAYPSQNQSKSTRLLLKWIAVKKKLNDDPQQKPKWMRKKTFTTLRKDCSDLEEKQQIADFFALRNSRSVDHAFHKYGMAIFAGDHWEEEVTKRGLFHPKELLYASRA